MLQKEKGLQTLQEKNQSQISQESLQKSQKEILEQEDQKMGLQIRHQIGRDLRLQMGLEILPVRHQKGLQDHSQEIQTKIQKESQIQSR